MLPTDAATTVAPFSGPAFRSVYEACCREYAAVDIACRLFWRRNRKKKITPAMSAPARSIPIATPATAPPSSPFLPVDPVEFEATPVELTVWLA